MGLTAALSVCLVLFAQEDGFYNQFENGGSGGWSFQNINDAIRWQVDSTPQIYVSPFSTLNNVDGVTGSGSQGVGEATAYSPTAIITRGSGRIFEHWCRYFVLAAEAPFKRRIQLGSNLLTENAFITFVYDVPDIAADDESIDDGEFLITCPTSAWHRHRFFFPVDSSDVIHNGLPIPDSAEFGSYVNAAVTLQVSLYFQWNETTASNSGGTEASVNGGVIAWFIDDLVIVRGSGNMPIPSPFAPQPGDDGGAGGGGTGGCNADVVPGSGGLASAAALLMVLIVAFLRLRVR